MATDFEAGETSAVLNETEEKWLQHCLGADKDQPMLGLSQVDLQIGSSGERIIHITLPNFVNFGARKKLEESLEKVFRDEVKTGSENASLGKYVFHVIPADVENKQQFEEERKQIETHVEHELTRILTQNHVGPLKIRIRPARISGKIQRLVSKKWNLVLDILTKIPQNGAVGPDLFSQRDIVEEFISDINSPVVDRIVKIHLHRVNPHLASFEEEESLRKLGRLHEKRRRRTKPVSS